MLIFEKKQKEDQVKEWLETLQVKFALSERESKNLFEVTRTCFAHNLDEGKIKRVILNFLKSTGHDLQMDEIDSGSIFVIRAGARRYEKWSWQGNAFGILAYLLTALFFRIDIIFPPNDQATVAIHQFFAVLLVLGLWCLLDKCSRARPKTIIVFDAVNRFMPGFTLLTYLVFHMCKMMFFHEDMRWILGMKVTSMAYVALGALSTLINMIKYRKVAILEKYNILGKRDGLQ